MSNNRYLEFDSTYRNRNEWPLASEFQIPISQTGRKSQLNSLDPVCLSTPIMTWTSNFLETTTAPSGVLNGTILFQDAIIISGTSDNQTFVIKSVINETFQQLENYYVGLVIIITSGSADYRRRITNYKYLGKDSSTDYNLGLITVASNFPESIVNGDSFSIKDPTDVDDVNNPYFFVPSGRVQKNGYTGYLLYNENLQQYRKISGYDSTTHMISLNTNTKDGGPLSSSWSVTDNYSIRKEIPYLPRNSSAYLNPISPFSINSIIVSTLPIPTINIGDYVSVNNQNGIITNIIGSNYTIKYDNGTIGNNVSLSQIVQYLNLYTNFAIRIVANFTLPQYYKYVDNIAIAPLNESRTIISSTYDNSSGNTILTLYPPLYALPDADTYFEILNFSYDNFNPFTYTGSLVSQQDMVCYEIELLNLILPNEVLAVGEGGRIAFYPYVYAQISNVSSAGGRLKNIIYSNNPNSTRAIFRIPIDDVINPLISTFIKVDGDGMVQTIKFKPNDNLYFSVFLANGELYETILPEYFSPAPPNPTSQISASFSIRRL